MSRCGPAPSMTSSGRTGSRSSWRCCWTGASKRNEAVDHLFFSGPPGLGKTTLGTDRRARDGGGLPADQGPALERPSDLAAILTNLGEGDVLFVDEIHRMPPAVEEVLYPALEDYSLDVVLGKGPTARSIRLDLPRFTLIAATTRPGRITLPLRERFGFSPRLDYYGAEDLTRIVLPAPASWASRPSGGRRRDRPPLARHPRIANRLLRRVRDVAEVRHDGGITADIARAGLAVFEVDEQGLDRLDHAILRAIIDRSSREDPSGCPRWPPPSGKSRTRWRTSWSPTSSSWDSCSAHRAGGWRRRAPTRISAWWRPASCPCSRAVPAGRIGSRAHLAPSARSNRKEPHDPRPNVLRRQSAAAAHAARCPSSCG